MIEEPAEFDDDVNLTFTGAMNPEADTEITYNYDTPDTPYNSED